MIPLHYYTAFGAFFLATVAAFFSITGLGALYAAAFIPIVIMGAAIEYGKIAATFWVHRNWKRSKIWCVLLVVVILASMAVTSGGVYGFLTKGHVDQQTPLTETTLRIERIDNQIRTEKNATGRAQARLDQLDGIIQTLINYDKISGPDGSRAVRALQESERDEMQALINESYSRIDDLNDTRLSLSQKVTQVEAKLGPVKFLAALFGLDTDRTIIWFTLLIVILLDPFAIMLIVATSMSYDRWREKKGIKIIDGEFIREVEKIVEIEKIVEVIKEVPVEIIVEKEVIKIVPEVVREEIPLSIESLTEFLENEKIQRELIKDPKLIKEVEKLLQEINNKLKPEKTAGWYSATDPLGKKDKS